MKSIERHKLKENDSRSTVAQAREVLDARKRDVDHRARWRWRSRSSLSAGFVWWRQREDGKATSLLASALAVSDAPVVPLAAPAPGSPAPLPQPGTFTHRPERLEAALPKFREAADRYPELDAGLVAQVPPRRHPRRRSDTIPEAEQTLPGRDQQAGSEQHLRAAPRASGWRSAGRAGQVRQRHRHLHRAQPRHDVADSGGQRADAARTGLRAGRPQGRSGAHLRPRRAGVPAVALRQPTPRRELDGRTRRS